MLCYIIANRREYRHGKYTVSSFVFLLFQILPILKNNTSLHDASSKKKEKKDEKEEGIY